MPNDLNSLIKRAEEKFDFNPEKYPDLVGLSEEAAARFAIRHAALHFAKSAGKIIAHSEDVDHGGEGNMEELKNDVAKSLLNTLRMAGLLHMKEEDLVSRIEKKLAAPINNPGT